MNICVVGLGSISGRHIKNIKELYDDVSIDVLRHWTGGTGVVVHSDFRTVYSHDDLKERYDAVFITNPTVMHVDTLLKLTDRSDAFFIEKPLRPLIHKDCADRTDMPVMTEFDTSVLPKGKIYYVACPLRYTAVVQYLKKNLDISKVYSIRAISSSYLPDWRPGTDYRRAYSANRAMGGGVAADLIHEWDYLSYLFGRPDRITGIERHISGLETDVEDIAVYIGSYKHMLAEVHLDYFGRKTIRELQVITKDDTIYCDLVSGTVTYLKEGRTLDLKQDRDDYQKAELDHFFAMARGEAENDSSAGDAEALLRLIEKGTGL